MAYPIAGVNIVQITSVQELFGQRVLNTFHFMSTVDSAVTDGETEVGNLADGVAEGLIAAIQAQQSNDLSHDSVYGQVIYPVRRNRVRRIGISGPGGRALASMPANVQVSFMRRGDTADKHNIGAIRVAGIPHADHLEGLLSGAAETAWGSEILPALKASYSISTTWTPVIFNRTVPNQSPRITSTTLMREIRTQRTRTNGRGV